MTNVAASDRRIIYDVGLHRGEDSEIYLKKGFKVVGVEANPDMCVLAATRLRPYVESGQFIIVNKAVSDEEGEVTFYKHPTKSVWGTIDHAWVARNEREFGGKVEEIRVPSQPLSRIIEEFGAPYFVKIDIEGLDVTALRSLSTIVQRPKYISIESEKKSFSKLCQEFEVFQSLGYRSFKVVPQHRVQRQRPPYPAREGLYVNHCPEKGSSGLFGEEAPGSWASAEEAIKKYRTIFLRYRLLGDDSLVRPRFLVQLLHRVGVLAGWHDTHARLGS